MANESDNRNRGPRARTPIEKLRLAVKITAIVLWAMFLVLLVVGITVGPGWLIGVGFGAGLLAFGLSGVRLPQQPEVWLIERWGRWRKNLSPGWHWVVPVVDTVRKKIRVFRHAISIFLPESADGRPAVDFIDGSVPVLNPVLYAIPDRDHPEHLIYRVVDWVNWIRDNVEPILLGYLRTLKIREALDEAWARGNLLERIREAKRIAQKKLELTRTKTTELKEEAKESPERVDILAPLIKEFEEAIDRLEGLIPVYTSLRLELAKKLKEAEGLGINEISGAFIGDFILPESIKAAREAPLIAQREAEAAYFEAVKESRLRAEPIFQTTAKLQEAGLSNEEALAQALTLEKLETLANKGIWTAGLAELVEKLAPSIVEAFLGRAARANREEQEEQEEGAET